MEPFTKETFGELNAEDYDALHDPGTTDQSVRLISELAGKGRILELAIGTGRVALPLARAGHDIAGIEGSAEMIAKLREKPGGEAIEVVEGDMADVEIEGPFDHAFLVFNTLFNLQSQAAQCACLRNVARVLAPGGSFLVEAFVPEFEGYVGNQRLTSRRMTRDSVWLEAIEHDPVAQMLEFQRVRITGAGMKLVPLRLRYAWPNEIDLMAQLAGLRREARWGGWQKEPFTAESRMHVTLYRKDAAGA